MKEKMIIVLNTERGQMKNRKKTICLEMDNERSLKYVNDQEGEKHDGEWKSSENETKKENNCVEVWLRECLLVWEGVSERESERE